VSHAPASVRRTVPAALAFVAVALVAGPARAGDAAETNFSWDLRFGGYFAASTDRTAWAGLAGAQFGAIHWFDQSLIGLQFLAGPGIGYMSTGLGVLGVTGDAGVIFATSRRSGTTISLNWAPKVLADFGHGFAKGEVSSPLGAEVAFDFSGFKLPIWALQTLDGTTMIGIAAGLGY
jgi:hypothetical protein